TDRQRQYLGDINAAGRRLLAVVNDVLDLSRIEAGHAELNLESLDVGNLVRSALAIFGQRASDKDLRLTAQLPEGVALLLADERKLKQMLYNYLDNAVKFTPEGGSVWVRVEDAEGELHFEVQDNGLGIARADLPKLFRPFAPLDGSASRRFEGTGLGLSLVKLLAELHGGRVWVKSEPGRGSTFGFSVPTNLSA
ncbi:MAG TPA: HAMP domain-containing sensor histidine kinase, partial [Trueperaceae bacterium]